MRAALCRVYYYYSLWSGEEDGVGGSSMVFVGNLRIKVFLRILTRNFGTLRLKRKNAVPHL